MTTGKQSTQKPSARLSRRRKSRTTKHFEALIRRVKTMADGEHEAPLTVGVTSCTPLEGTSTVAANLAIAAAQVANGPVLLVDANVSRPSLSRTFRVNNGKGLSNALIGDGESFECVVDSGLDNLSLMLPGSAKPNRKPSYSPSDITELVDMLKHVFSFIVFDLEHASELTTCFAFAPRMDGLLLVLEANRVNRSIVARRQQQLKDMRANLLGVVMNKYGK